MKSRTVTLERKRPDCKADIPTKKPIPSTGRLISLSRSFDPYGSTLSWHQPWRHDGVSGREQPLQLLSQHRMHSMLTSGTDSSCNTIPQYQRPSPTLPKSSFFIVDVNSSLPVTLQPATPIDLRTDLRVAMPAVDPAIRECQLQQELQLLQQQHQIQKQLLFAEFQKQHESLTRQHQVQLQEHLKQQQELLAVQHQQELLEQERKLEKHRQEQELGRHLREQHLLILRNKERGRESAVASTEVKQKLQEFLLNKSATKESPPSGQNHSFPQHPNLWGAHHASLDHSSPPQSGTSASYKQPLPGIQNTKDDFPLRKTASEPNLKVRSRLKQKVAERRSSPLLRRKDGTIISTFKKRTLERTDSTLSNSAPGSGPSSPNNSSSAMATENGVSHSHTEHLPLHHRILTRDGSLNALSLYTSPSLPNITLGLPATAVTSTSSQKNTTTSTKECDRQTIQGMNQGTALTGQFRGSAPLPAYLPPALFDGKVNSTHHALLQHILLMEQARKQSSLTTGVVPLHPQSPLVGIGERVSPSLRASKKMPRHRPLNRTHSAPLPQCTHALAQLVVQQQHQQFLEKQKQYQQKIQLNKTLSKPHEQLRQPESHPEETEEELCQQQAIQEDEGPPCGSNRSNSNGTCERAAAECQSDMAVQMKQEPLDSDDEIQFKPTDHEENNAFFQQQFQEHQRVQHLRVYQSPMALVGMTGLDKHRPVSRTQSSPAASTLPHPSADQPIIHVYTTGH